MREPTEIASDEDARHRFVLERWKVFEDDPLFRGRLPTEHLPDSVVGPDLYIYTGSFTDPEDARRGVLSTAIRYDGRGNPELSPDEAEYVVMTLLAAARRIWRLYGDDRTPELPHD